MKVLSIPHAFDDSISKFNHAVEAWAFVEEAVTPACELAFAEVFPTKFCSLIHGGRMLLPSLEDAVSEFFVVYQAFGPLADASTMPVFAGLFRSSENVRSWIAVGYHTRFATPQFTYGVTFHDDVKISAGDASSQETNLHDKRILHMVRHLRHILSVRE